MDEKETNLLWSVSAYEGFHYALNSGDYVTCKLIIKDAKDKGFEDLSAQMDKELMDEPASKFTNPSSLLWM